MFISSFLSFLIINHFQLFFYHWRSEISTKLLKSRLNIFWNFHISLNWCWSKISNTDKDHKKIKQFNDVITKGIDKPILEWKIKGEYLPPEIVTIIEKRTILVVNPPSLMFNCNCRISEFRNIYWSYKIYLYKNDLYKSKETQTFLC